MTKSRDLFGSAPAKDGRRIPALGQVEDDDAGAAEFSVVRRGKRTAAPPGPLFASLSKDRDSEVDLPKLGQGAAETEDSAETGERDKEEA